MEFQNTALFSPKSLQANVVVKIGPAAKRQTMRHPHRCAQEGRLHPAAIGGYLEKRQSFVAKYELGKRRLDVAEFITIAKILKADAVSIIKSLV